MIFAHPSGSGAGGSRTARILTDLSPTTSPSQFYAMVAEQMPSNVMLAFGSGIYRELRRELHSAERIAEWATDVARKANRPVLMNVEFVDGTSRTFAVAPPGWTQERLSGYLAARHAELEETFGEISAVHSPPRGAA